MTVTGGSNMFLDKIVSLVFASLTSWVLLAVVLFPAGMLIMVNDVSMAFSAMLSRGTIQQRNPKAPAVYLQSIRISRSFPLIVPAWWKLWLGFELLCVSLSVLVYFNNNTILPNASAVSSLNSLRVWEIPGHFHFSWLWCHASNVRTLRLTLVTVI